MPAPPPRRDPADIRRDVILTLHTLGVRLDDQRLRAVLTALASERRDAWRQGWHDANTVLRRASNAISAAVDWPAEARRLENVYDAIKFRARMLDPRPRPHDFPGRGRGDAA